MTALGPNGLGFHHVAMKVADLDASLRFYVEGLGLTRVYGWGEADSRAVLLDIGDGRMIEVFAGGTDDPKPEGAFLHLCLRTADCDAALAAAVQAGAVTMAEPHNVTIPTRGGPVPVRLAFCRTPSGEILEFLQQEAT